MNRSDSPGLFPVVHKNPGSLSFRGDPACFPDPPLSLREKDFSFPSLST